MRISSLLKETTGTHDWHASTDYE